MKKGRNKRAKKIYRLTDSAHINKMYVGLFLLSFLTVGFAVYLSKAANLSVILQSYATGFSSPVAIANSRVAGDGRLFIVQKGGQIKIIRADGSVASTPYLDITSRVNSGANERGMLGLAFHPNYGTNGFFFVTYNNSAGALVVSRFTKSASNPDLADNTTERIIITVPHPTYDNHNGGNIAFGPDGYLYIGTGDGGSGGDPFNSGQNKDSLLGKILRLDINSGNPYAIPAGNPFVGQAGLDEVWAWGLRNPWRFSFDRSTGDLFIADVGQGAWEEVNWQQANGTGGQNYGWRCYEGYAAYNTSGCGASSSYTQPVTVYDHGNGRCSLTGGYRYRGNAYPNMSGYYFFADYCNGQLFSITPGGSPGTWVQEIQGQYSVNISTFGEDINGEIYVASLSNGVIYRLQSTVSSSDTTPPTVSLTAPANNATLTGTIAINANASDNVAVAKVDFIIDGTISNTDTASPYSYNWNTASTVNGSHTIVARATDSSGNVTNSSQISVTTSNFSNLPAPWQGRDIGSVAAPGNAAYAAGVFTIEGSGSDIFGTADEFYYVSQALNGDGRITVRVDSIQNTNPWAKAGIMIRETTAAASKHASVYVTPSNGIVFSYRSTTGASTAGNSSATGQAPKWLRLERTGDEFSASHSVDGNNWQHMGTQVISMTSSTSIGMAVSSVSDGLLSRSVFSSVSVGVGVPSIDITSPGHSDTFTGVNNITTDATDDVGVTKVEFYVDNTLISTDTTAPFGFSWDTTSLTNTTHTLTAIAYDASANTGSHTHIVATQNTARKIGDCNNDGRVDVFDLSILLTNYGTNGDINRGDNNGDGVVNIFDLSRLLSNYGQ